MASYFSAEELKKIDMEHLQDVADYLDIQYPSNITKSKLIRMILGVQYASNDVSSSGSNELPIPKYSVRVQRIIDLKEKGEL